jgi:hypothetical protein
MSEHLSYAIETVMELQAVIERRDAHIARLRAALQKVKDNSADCTHCSASLFADEALAIER